MSRVITFSTKFPSYHPRKGEPTHFVEKILRGIHVLDDHTKKIMDMDIWSTCDPKWHTIRSGNRWKVGDKFSPRVWGTDINPTSGRSGPYHSKQITIAPDIEIKKTFDFKVDQYRFIIDGKPFYHQHVSEWHSHMDELCKNDGLSFGELLAWFKVPCQFDGQIISWSNNINY